MGEGESRAMNEKEGGTEEPRTTRKARTKKGEVGGRWWVKVEMSEAEGLVPKAKGGGRVVAAVALVRLAPGLRRTTFSPRCAALSSGTLPLHAREPRTTRKPRTVAREHRVPLRGENRTASWRRQAEACAGVNSRPIFGGASQMRNGISGAIAIVMH